MRILITGASGFIGRYLSEFAVGQGHEVIGTHVDPAELSVRGLPAKGVQWRRLNVQDPNAVERLVTEVRPEAVFHLAGQAFAQKAWSDPADTFRTNVFGTIYLYETLRQHPPPGGY